MCNDGRAHAQLSHRVLRVVGLTYQQCNPHQVFNLVLDEVLDHGETANSWAGLDSQVSVSSIDRLTAIVTDSQRHICMRTSNSPRSSRSVL